MQKIAILVFFFIVTVAACQSQTRLGSKTVQFLGHTPYDPRTGPNRVNTYYVSNYFTTAFEAESHCRRLGRKLVSIQSIREQQTLEDLLENHHVPRHGYWTSGTDAGTENRFFWATGELFQYKNFMFGAKNGPNEDCVLLNGPFGNHWNMTPFKWSIKNCSDQYFFICEN